MFTSFAEIEAFYGDNPTNEFVIKHHILGHPEEIVYFVECGKQLHYTDQYWHRIGGPARVRHNSIVWYVKNRHVTTIEGYCHLCGYDGAQTLMLVLKYGEMLPSNLAELEGFNLNVY